MPHQVEVCMNIAKKMLSGKSRHQSTPSKASSITFLSVFSALGYVVCFGLFLYRKGQLNPSTFLALVLIATFAGVAFGFIMWHLYFKRHQL
jgi:hypothetical protein